MLHALTSNFNEKHNITRIDMTSIIVKGRGSKSEHTQWTQKMPKIGK